MEITDNDWTTDTPHHYKLRLFVAGTSPVSVRAMNNLQHILQEHLFEQYELEIIDAYQQPLLAQQNEVIAIPMLIKMEPGLKRRLVGDMSNKSSVLKGLGIS